MLDSVTILVAEDNLLNQRVLKFIFQRVNASVKFALTGKEAIDLLEQEPFDIILMDLQMPEMDGLTATKHIRQTMKNTTPIVAITAGRFADENELCLEAGMNACVFKPFEADSLCALIKNIVSNNNPTS